MAVYQRIFTVPDVAETHVLFLRAVRAAEAADRERARAGLRPAAAATRRELLRAYDEFNRNMERLAQRTADDATRKIQRRLKLTAQRPDTGVRPHIRDAIVSRPLRRFGPVATGEVGVADERPLNKVVNPNSPQFGPYWFAQEFGTNKHVGREIRGYFYGTGMSNPTRPLAQYKGGGGPHPIFVAGAKGPRGGKGGKGRIDYPIKPRHFIRDGADEARVQWLAGVRAVERQTERRLSAVLSGSFTRRRPVGGGRVRPRRRRF